ncbi:IncA family protein [Chlamydia crocodili]|uniref:IncA family protein n=1 Tax=Chlamydia crocodili TaxID=2766982 RepID=A0ABX8CFW2_9CHLA|nr:IncA family protein [Chlamydia crocodili]QVE49334.1 IncA family protein [Chlamydia crocodili]
MKCASPCFYLKSENSDDRCCNFLDSRVRLVATILSIIASLLIVTGAIAAVVLFGLQLGLLYSTIIIGLSVAIGVLLFSASLRCFTCCALVSRSQHISENIARPYVHDSGFPQRSSTSCENAEKIEQHLRDVVSECAQARVAYQDLINQRDESITSLRIAREAYESADADYQRLSGQFVNMEGNRSINQECQECFITLRERCLDYIQSVHAYEAILEQISSMHNLLDFQKIASAYEQVNILLREREENSQERICALENQLSLRNRDLEQLSQMENELQISIRELQRTHEANQGTIRALQIRLEEVGKSRGILDNTPFLEVGDESRQHIEQTLSRHESSRDQGLQEENRRLKLTLGLYHKMFENIETRLGPQYYESRIASSDSEGLLREFLGNSEQYTRGEVDTMVSQYFENERGNQQKEVSSLREQVAQQDREIHNLRMQIVEGSERNAGIRRDLNTTSLDIIDMTLEENTIQDIIIIDGDEFMDASENPINPK